MMKGFYVTLLAASMSLVGWNAAFATAPTIGNIPAEVKIGDSDPGDNPAGTDNNYFVFTNAFQFSTKVTPGQGSVASNLVWTFGEFDWSATGATLPANWGPGQSRAYHYTVNGVAAANKGDTAIANDALANSPNAKNVANKINGAANTAADFATFRDVIWTPTNLTGPFPGPISAAEIAKGAEGKFVRFYVSDENGYIVSKDMIVKSIDGGVDMISGGGGWTQTVKDTLGNTNGWIGTGTPGAPGIDVTDAQVSSSSTELKITVQTSSSRYRIEGWGNFGLMNYQNVVGSTNYVRGKFFIYATPTVNPATAPINNVPNFRIKVFAGASAQEQIGINDFSYSATGESGPVAGDFYSITNNAAEETNAGIDIQPSRDSTKPSMYRVDLDPVDVPSLNTAAGKIGASIESMATSNNAAATLTFSELQLGVYPADVDGSGLALLDYKANDPTNGAASKNIVQNAFNALNDFTPGRRQEIYFGTTPPLGQAGEVFATVLADTGSATVGSIGFGFDTSPIPTNRFGVGVADVTAKTPATMPRMSANKRYRARFHVTSSLKTSDTNSANVRFGSMRVRVQLAQGGLAARLELPGPANAAAGTNTILKETLPGVGTANPESVAGYQNGTVKGGWYTAIFNSLLTPYVHPERGGTGSDDALAASRMPVLSAQPGPGNTTSGSYRDLACGVDALKQAEWVTLAFPNFPTTLFPKNDVQFRCQEIHLSELPEVDDGGYNATLP